MKDQKVETRVFAPRLAILNDGTVVMDAELLIDVEGLVDGSKIAATYVLETVNRG